MYNSNSKTDQKGKNWISIILSFVKNAWDLRIIRFIVIGSFNTLFDTSLLLIIVKISGLSPVIVNSVSVSIAITVSYFLNHRIVFRQKSSYSLKKYIRFFLITGLGVIIIQDTIIYLVTDKFWIVNKTITTIFIGHTFYLKTLELLGTKFIAVAVGLTWNFVLYKYIVFRDHETIESKEDRLVIG